MTNEHNSANREDSGENGSRLPPHLPSKRHKFSESMNAHFIFNIYSHNFYYLRIGGRQTKYNERTKSQDRTKKSNEQTNKNRTNERTKKNRTNEQEKNRTNEQEKNRTTASTERRRISEEYFTSSPLHCPSSKGGSGLETFLRKFVTKNNTCITSWHIVLTLAPPVSFSSLNSPPNLQGCVDTPVEEHNPRLTPEDRRASTSQIRSSEGPDLAIDS